MNDIRSNMRNNMSSRAFNSMKPAVTRGRTGNRAPRTRSATLGALLALSLSLAFTSAPAAAGDRGHGYRAGHSDFRAAVRHGYRHDNRRYRAAHRGYRHGYRDGYRHNRHYRKHRRHHNNDAAYLIGGLVLGSVITHAVSNRYEQPSYHGRHYNRLSTREVVYVNQAPAVRTYSTAPRVTEGRRLYRDLDGNCFERLNDDAGNELLQEPPESACDW